uniref:Uncharacterized protein n=1 Tax=Anguilla anguilla TaxID=7936 RepID=A0A0E9QM01_ANGAN
MRYLICKLACATCTMCQICALSAN